MMLDKDQKTRQVLYQDTVDWVNENIPGHYFMDKVEVLRNYWTKTKGKTYMELLGQDIINSLKQQNG